MKLLVTGGAGFIGSNYVRQVLSGTYPNSDKYDVTVLDSLTYAGNLANLDLVSENPNFEFVHGDILDTDLVNDLVSQSDAVVHFAAESHVDRSINAKNRRLAPCRSRGE